MWTSEESGPTEITLETSNGSVTLEVGNTLESIRRKNIHQSSMGIYIYQQIMATISVYWGHKKSVSKLTLVIGYRSVFRVDFGRIQEMIEEIRREQG